MATNIQYGVQVKGISFNFLSFLWKAFGKIWELRLEGQYQAALEVAIELLDFVPHDIEEKMQKDVEKIREVQAWIRGEIQAPSDFVKVHNTEKALQIFAAQSLTEFVRKMKRLLEPRGYFEIQREPIPRATSSALRKNQ